MSSDNALSLLSRYEALFELSGDINAATEIETAAQLLAGRLKYVADVYSWRYLRIETDGAGEARESTALVVDGYRGQGMVQRTTAPALCAFEMRLWDMGRAQTLGAEELDAVRAILPAPFQKPDIAQAYVCPRFGAGDLEGMFLFSKRRQPFNPLDIKFLTLIAQIFHDKVQVLWEHAKRRELETAYLEQEIMLRQSEKLATLGRLSAGIAHEVNNPLAAALRNAAQLVSELQEWEQGLEALSRVGLSEEQLTAAARARDAAVELARQPPTLDLLVRADRESDVEDWLDGQGVANGWQLAPTLVSMGFDPAQLEAATEPFSSEQVPAVLTTLSHHYAAHALLEGIQTSTRRVSEIVTALKSYSHLDQAPVQTVDVHEGLNDTLAILQSKLGVVTVRKEFDPELPPIEAYGRELNQVWTNIIDNAIQAMAGEGELSLRTYLEDSWVVVEISDNGPGIPAELQERIFDPFFTTKPPGAGAGLGLNISHNIVVQKHGGQIEVHSAPGATSFRVRLPLRLAASEP